MLEKKYGGAPFGTQTARFDVSGVHPGSKMPGAYTQIPYCPKALHEKVVKRGPGQYNIEQSLEFGEKSVAERAAGPGWARAHEVERMAQLPHLLYKEQWEQKRQQKRKLGPGTYHIKDFLELDEIKPRSTHGIVDTRATRFKSDELRGAAPGPGTYGKGGIPQAGIEEKANQSTSTIGMLDGGPKNRNLPSVGCHLAPGTYKHRSFTQDLLEKKVCSTRGPYDMFTGDRTKPVKTGHWAIWTNANLGPGQYDLGSFTDDMKSQERAKHGRFGKVAQYPTTPCDRIWCFSLSQKKRNSWEPAPAQYDPVNPAVKQSTQSPNAPSFLTSSNRNDKRSVKFFTGNNNAVGAGRYDVQRFEEAQAVNGYTNVFKSKTQRQDVTNNKFWQERIRSKDMPKKDRVHLIKPEHPHTALHRKMDFMQRADAIDNWKPPRAVTVI